MPKTAEPSTSSKTDSCEIKVEGETEKVEKIETPIVDDPAELAADVERLSKMIADEEAKLAQQQAEKHTVFLELKQVLLEEQKARQAEDVIGLSICIFSSDFHNIVFISVACRL